VSGWGGRRNPGGGCVTAVGLAVIGTAVWLVALVALAVVL
jgi:hypothetical protein